MPMIDVYATAGTFADQHRWPSTLAATVMTVEQVPDIPMFRKNTAGLRPRAARRAISRTSTATATTSGSRC